MIVCLSMFSMSSSNLDVVLVSDGLENIFLLSKVWKMDVYRSTQSSAEVGGTRGDVAEVVIMRELSNLFNMGASLREPSENSPNVSTRLHGDDAELIFFIHPNQEGLLVVMEDASSLRPLSIKSTCLQIAVAFFEQEVVSNELLAISLGHFAQRVELASKLSRETLKGLYNGVLNIDSLLLAYSRSKREGS